MQFRLRTLFILTAATALLVWIFFVPPDWLGLLVLWIAHALLPAVTIAGIVYHRGYRQAFFIGTAPWTVLSATIVFWAAIFPWFPGSWPFSGSSDEILNGKFLLALSMVIAIAGGFLAVAIRWWAIYAEKRSQ